ncbi:MAG: flagellar export chaperone FliS [candidate division Zixibacteria bacterium]|nr:flagellar export chaperone FliS [candidate division Zixibacteria bacterium]
MKNNIKTYERIQTEGLNQKQLIIMMYSGINRFLREAQEALAKEEYSISHEKFNRARKVVFHLLSTLNLEAGEIAAKLKLVYLFLIEKITEANLTRNASLVNDLLPIVDNIKEGWEQIELNDESIPDDKRKISTQPNQQVSITI